MWGEGVTGEGLSMSMCGRKRVGERRQIMVEVGCMLTCKGLCRGGGGGT